MWLRRRWEIMLFNLTWGNDVQEDHDDQMCGDDAVLLICENGDINLIPFG